MKRVFIALAVAVALAIPAGAKDFMITLNDQERSALQEILDVAAKASGTKQAGLTANALYFSDKLNKAPEVIERKDDDAANKDAPK